MPLEKSINYQEPTVFLIERGSQYKGILSEGKYYNSALSLINNMLSNNKLESEIVGLSGTKQDLAVFLASFFNALEFQNTKFTTQTEGTRDYDPDCPIGID